jgi:hypothetical protein
MAKSKSGLMNPQAELQFEDPTPASRSANERCQVIQFPSESALAKQTPAKVSKAIQRLLSKADSLHW